MAKTIQSITKFYFSLGGYRSSHHEFTLEGNQLSYETWVYFDDRKLTARKLSDRETTQLIDALNESQYLSWNSNYYNNEVHDGTQWEVNIQYNGSLRKKVVGSNEYPLPQPGADFMDESPSFLILLKAMRRLESNFPID